jgi:hypothetical protein
MISLRFSEEYMSVTGFRIDCQKRIIEEILSMKCKINLAHDRNYSPTETKLQMRSRFSYLVLFFLPTNNVSLLYKIKTSKNSASGSTLVTTK